MNIVTIPSSSLRRRCIDVVKFDDELASFIDALVDTMYIGNGVGIAAPQVDDPRRVVVIDPSGGDDSNQMTIMINPRVSWVSDDTVLGVEGCLSVPGRLVRIPRHSSLNVDYFDLSGNVHSDSTIDLRARVIQHELDHLDGITILDRQVEILKLNRRVVR